MNIELLEEVRDFIVKYPCSVDMDYSEQETICGTVACIAGWTLILNGESCLRYPQWEEEAGKLLKLTSSQCYDLFYGRNWPLDLYWDLYESVKGSQRYANIVAERIDRFIKGD